MAYVLEKRAEWIGFWWRWATSTGWWASAHSTFRPLNRQEGAVFSELQLASQSVLALGTLLKAASGLANYNEIVAKVSEVNSKLMAANAVALAAQEKQSNLAAQIAVLEHEVKQIKDWQAEAQNYEAREVASGVFAYLLRSHAGKLASAEKLCAKCFSQGNKSLLQQQHVEVGRQLSLICHRCKANVIFRHYQEAA